MLCFWFGAKEHKTRTRTSIARKPHNKFPQTENSQYIPIQIHSVHSWMLWIKTNQNEWMLWDQRTKLFIEQEQQKNYCIKIINWKNKKKKSLTTFFDVIPKSKIPHSLMLYPNKKNPTFFDVIPILWFIPKSKIPSIHMKKTETTDLKWIGGREVGLRQSAMWVWG